MLQNWSRWDKNDDYAQYEQVEVVYIDNKNQICLKKENTADLDWSRTTDIIIGWRPVLKTKSIKVINTPAKKEEKEIVLVRYWNFMKGKMWPNIKVPPNPKLPYYLKVTMTLKNGKIDTQYEMHSIYEPPICHCRHEQSTN